MNIDHWIKEHSSCVIALFVQAALVNFLWSMSEILTFFSKR
jgi:hypothetical protein